MSIATQTMPTMRDVLLDCARPGFVKRVVVSMVCQLQLEGLVIRHPDGCLELTPLAFDWLSSGRFDRQPPKPHTRPKARKREVRP